MLCHSAPETAGSSLAVIDPADGSVKELKTPYTSYGNVYVQQVHAWQRTSSGACRAQFCLIPEHLLTAAHAALSAASW